MIFLLLLSFHSSIEKDFDIGVPPSHSVERELIDFYRHLDHVFHLFNDMPNELRENEKAKFINEFEEIVSHLPKDEQENERHIFMNEIKKLGTNDFPDFRRIIDDRIHIMNDRLNHERIQRDLERERINRMNQRNTVFSRISEKNNNANYAVIGNNVDREKPRQRIVSNPPQKQRKGIRIFLVIAFAAVALLIYSNKQKIASLIRRFKRKRESLLD